MCDVDDEAVVAAVDAPSHLRHPEGAARRGPRRLRRAPARAAFRDVDWTAWDELLRRVHQPGARGHGRPGRQVHRPARRLPLGHRGAAGRRLRQRRQVAHPLGRLRRLRRRPRAPRRELDDVDAVCVPGGFGVRGIEGKLGALRLRPRATASRPWACAWACSAWSSSTPATWPASTAPTPPSSTTRRRTRSSPRWPTSATSSRASATWAAPCASASTRPSSPRARWSARSTARPRVDERHRHRYEVNNAYREQLEEAGLVFSGTSPDGRLVEYVELPRDVHPYYVGTQAHPELRSRPTRAAPAVRRAGRRGARPAARAVELADGRRPRRASVDPPETRARSPTRRPPSCTVRSSRAGRTTGMVWDVRRDERRPR